MDFIPFFFVICAVFLAGTFDNLYTVPSERTGLKPALIFTLALVLLVALATFRAVGVGNDDRSYVEIFSKIPSVIDCRSILCGYKYEDINVEFGFFELLSFLHLIGDNKFLLFGTVALLSVLFNLKSIQFYAVNFCGSVMIYFCHFYIAKDLNAIRVGLATAIAFYATKFLYQKQVLIFISLTLFASLFHVSALLVIFPAILTYLNPGRKSLIASTITILVISSLFHLSQLITPLIELDFLKYKLSLYSGAGIYNYAIPLLDIVNVRNLAIAAVCLMFWDDLCEFDEKFKFTFYFFFSAVFFRILFGDFAIVAGRGYSAISMFEYIMFPTVFMYLFGKRTGYVLIFLFALATLCLNLFVSTAWTGGVRYFG